ncbi:MAG: hypothetical protein ACP5R4_01320, partial [Armatimonadota bacterium]
MGNCPAPCNSHPPNAVSGRRAFLRGCRLCRGILAALFAVGLTASPAVCQRTERAVLSNGMTVIVRTNSGAQIAAASLFVRAGALDEIDCPAGSNYLLANILT